MDMQEVIVMALIVPALLLLFKLKDLIERERKRKRAARQREDLYHCSTVLHYHVQEMHKYRNMAILLTRRLEACNRFEIFNSLHQSRFWLIHGMHLEAHNNVLGEAQPWLQIEVVLGEIDLLFEQIVNLRTDNTGMEFVELIDAICSIPTQCPETNQSQDPFAVRVRDIEYRLRYLADRLIKLDESTTGWEKRIKGSHEALKS